MAEGKKRVLDYLRNKSQPTGIQELKGQLNIPERSIRRWLMELIAEGVIIKSGHTKNARYAFYSKEKAFPYFSELSQLILEKVEVPLYQRPPVTYNEAWVDSYIANETYYLSREASKRLEEAGTRMNGNEPAGTYAHKIYNRLLIDLSYNSSRLEGNTYSLLDTERLLLQGSTPEGKLDEEKVMILNHKEAIRYLVENSGSLTVSLNTILTLHLLLSDGLLDWKYSGKVRDHGVRIGGSVYIPIESQQRLQRVLERIIEKAAIIINPYEQSLFLLIHLSYLQAFADVNKRTARLSCNIPLIPKNLVPCSFNDIERTDYTSAMIAIYELQEINPIIDLYIYSYLRTCQAYDTTVNDVKFDAIRVQYRQQRRAIEREIILQQLVGASMLSYIDRSLADRIPVSDQEAVKKDLIEDLGRMNPISIAGLGITQEELVLWQTKQQF